MSIEPANDDMLCAAGWSQRGHTLEDALARFLHAVGRNELEDGIFGL